MGGPARHLAWGGGLKHLRLTEEQLRDITARLKANGTVRVHRVYDEPDSGKPPRIPKPKVVKPKAKIGRPSIASKLEQSLRLQMRAEGIQEPVGEFKAVAGRRFRLDFAWPTRRKGVEVQGMVHRIKEKFKRDIEKRAELLLAGWRVLEVDGDSIRDGRAIAWIKRMLA